MPIFVALAVACPPRHQFLRVRLFADSGGFDLKPPHPSLLLPTPLINLTSVFFPPLLSTSPPLYSPPASTLAPTSLHFFLSWRSPGNFIQTGHKGTEQRSGHTNEGLYIFRLPESYNPSSTTPSLSSTAAGCPSISRSLPPSFPLFFYDTRYNLKYKPSQRSGSNLCQLGAEEKGKE